MKNADEHRTTVSLSKHDWDSDIGGWKHDLIATPKARVTALYSQGELLDPLKYEVESTSGFIRWAGSQKTRPLRIKAELSLSPAVFGREQVGFWKWLAVLNPIIVAIITGAVAIAVAMMNGNAKGASADGNHLTDRLLQVLESGERVPVSIANFSQRRLAEFLDESTHKIVVVAQNMKTHMDRGILRIMQDRIDNDRNVEVQVVLTTIDFFLATARGTNRDSVATYVKHYAESIKRLTKLKEKLGSRANQLKVFFDTGASSLSLLIRDPGIPNRAALVATMKLTTDQAPSARVLCIIRESEAPHTFSKLNGPVRRLMENDITLTEVRNTVQELCRQHGIDWDGLSDE